MACAPRGARRRPVGRVDRHRPAGRFRFGPFREAPPKRRPQISKPHLDSFIAASARDPFTARIVVDTGDSWGPNARKTIERLKPACAVLRFGDLAGRPFDWPDLARDAPEDLAFRHEPFRLRPHQQAAFDDVLAGFRDHGSRQARHGLRRRQDLLTCRHEMAW